MNEIGQKVLNDLPQVVLDEIIAHLYTYNNVVILRYVVQLRNNNVEDLRMLGRMCLYLLTPETHEHINDALRANNKPEISWRNSKLPHYSGSIIVATIKDYGLKNQQPFAEYRKNKKKGIQQLIPLIYVLFPDALETTKRKLSEQRSIQRQKIKESNIEYCQRMGFVINSHIYYPPNREYGVITSISHTGMVHYDTVAVQPVVSAHEPGGTTIPTWRSSVLPDVIPIWTHVEKRGNTREARTLFPVT